MNHPLLHGVSIAFAAVLGTLCLTGCGGEKQYSVHPVEGKVLVGGQPAAGAFVTFHPVENKEPRVFPTMTVEADGSYRLSTYKGYDGAPEGEYLVTVVWEENYREDGETVSKGDKLKQKYADKTGSGLKATVKKGKNQLPTFELSVDN